MKDRRREGNGSGRESEESAERKRANGREGRSGELADKKSM